MNINDKVLGILGNGHGIPERHHATVKRLLGLAYVAGYEDRRKGVVDMMRDIMGVEDK